MIDEKSLNMTYTSRNTDYEMTKKTEKRLEGSNNW